MIAWAGALLVLGVIMFIISLAYDKGTTGIISIGMIAVGALSIIVFSGMNDAKCEDVREILVETNGEQYCLPRVEVATWEPAT